MDYALKSFICSKIFKGEKALEALLKNYTKQLLENLKEELKPSRLLFSF